MYQLFGEWTNSHSIGLVIGSLAIALVYKMVVNTNKAKRDTIVKLNAAIETDVVHDLIVPQKKELCYNPSLIEWKGKALLAYRVEPSLWKASRIHLGETDLATRRVTYSRELTFQAEGVTKETMYEDPRLFEHDNSLWVACTYVPSISALWGNANGTVSQAYGRLDDNMDISEFHIIDTPGSVEKNWQFFSHEEELYAVKHIEGHRIVKVNGSNHEQVHEQKMGPIWEYGEARGGTPPVRVGDSYYSFFHSHIQNGDQRIYVVGFYEFSAKAPFNITRVSVDPILKGTELDNKHPAMDDGFIHHVIFPCGAILKDDKWVISVGLNDQRCGIVYLEHTHLLSKCRTL